MTQLIKSNNKPKHSIQSNQQTFILNFDAIGTHWQIDINQSISPAKQQLLINKIKERIEAFDKTYSRFRKDSKITEIASHKGIFPFPPDSEKLFTLYKKLYDLTNGAFTPLIGNTLSEAGYDAKYSLTPKKILQLPTWDQSFSYESEKVTVYQPSILDFGAGGKGYLIDIIARLLNESDIKNFCINAGGDILYSNPAGKALRVGLESPLDTGQVIGVVTIKNKSICGSAGNRRKWGNYHHIINPHTNTSPSEILATWVIAGETILADALSTCLFLTPVKNLINEFQFEYFILFPDYTFEKSPSFSAELFIK